MTQPKHLIYCSLEAGNGLILCPKLSAQPLAFQIRANCPTAAGRGKLVLLFARKQTCQKHWAGGAMLLEVLTQPNSRALPHRQSYTLETLLLRDQTSGARGTACRLSDCLRQLLARNDLLTLLATQCIRQHDAPVASRLSSAPVLLSKSRGPLPRAPGTLCGVSLLLLSCGATLKKLSVWEKGYMWDFFHFFFFLLSSFPAFQFF